jgi:DNA-binding cell septation regulator SpoVG
MALTNNDQTSIREFLLGKLGEDEQQRIEQRLMVEDDLFEEFEISKGELVEEYCANELTREEHQWFERNFLASPEGKERYALAVALGRLQREPSEPPRPLTLLERLKDLFKHPAVIATAGAAAVVVIVAAVFLSRPAGQTVVGPTLASTMINREQGILPTKVIIPSNASELKLRLSLPPDASASANYRAELDNKTEIKPVRVVERDREGVWVSIPVSQLPRGEYSLKLAAIVDGTEREIPGDYLFNVE